MTMRRILVVVAVLAVTWAVMSTVTKTAPAAPGPGPDRNYLLFR